MILQFVFIYFKTNKPKLFVSLFVFCCVSLFSQNPDAKGYDYTIKKSKTILGIEWMGEEIPFPDSAKKGDTFPITWADDNNQYTSAGDPLWGNKWDGLDLECFTGDAPKYKIDKINDMPDFKGYGGNGPKPTGLISIKGVLYLAFQNLTGIFVNAGNAEYSHGYDASIVFSTDHGKTWNPDITKNRTPIFPGRMFGAPAFINYGKDNEGATDNYVYIISGEGWSNGSNCRLARAPADKIMDATAWQFVKENKSGNQPVWTNNIYDAIPVITHDEYLGAVDMVYITKLKRYLLLSWHFKTYSDPNNGSEIVIYESPQPWGPFSLVCQEKWETNEKTPYNPRIPLKWFDQDKLEGWILFSGTWRNGGSTPYYRSHIRKFKLLLNSDKNF